jgi:hypothetical protein
MTFRSLVPVADPNEGIESTEAACRTLCLDDATIGIMYNAKPNGRELLTAIAELLCVRYPIKKVVGPIRTEDAMLPSEAQLDAMAAETDLVLTGLGDCGSCSALSTHVAIDFERRGIPAVMVGTTPFEKSVKAMATRQGYPDFEFVKVTHPLGSLDMDALRERALEALPQVLSILGVEEGGLTGASEMAPVRARRG